MPRTPPPPSFVHIHSSVISHQSFLPKRSLSFIPVERGYVFLCRLGVAVTFPPPLPPPTPNLVTLDPAPRRIWPSTPLIVPRFFLFDAGDIFPNHKNSALCAGFIPLFCHCMFADATRFQASFSPLGHSPLGILADFSISHKALLFFCRSLHGFSFRITMGPRFSLDGFVWPRR